jgi:hypothetical protein
MERLAEDQAESILRKAVELAQGGDVTCLRMMLDRLYPARKGQPSPPWQRSGRPSEMGG